MTKEQKKEEPEDYKKKKQVTKWQAVHTHWQLL